MKLDMLLVSMVAGLGVACGHATPGYVGYTKLEPGSPYWVAYDSNRRGGLILVQQEKLKDAYGVERERSVVLSCSEPPPDVASTEESGLDAQATVPSGKVKGAIDFKNKRQVVIVAHRSEDVEMLRESYFRLCELSLREGWTAAQLNERYGQVLAVYRQIVSSRVVAECFKAKAALAATKPDAAAGMDCDYANLSVSHENPLVQEPCSCALGTNTFSQGSNVPIVCSGVRRGEAITVAVEGKIAPVAGSNGDTNDKAVSVRLVGGAQPASWSRRWRISEVDPRLSISAPITYGPETPPSLQVEVCGWGDSASCLAELRVSCWR